MGAICPGWLELQLTGQYLNLEWSDIEMSRCDGCVAFVLFPPSSLSNPPGGGGGGGEGCAEGSQQS